MAMAKSRNHNPNKLAPTSQPAHPSFLVGVGRRKTRWWLVGAGVQPPSPPPSLPRRRLDIVRTYLLPTHPHPSGTAESSSKRSQRRKTRCPLHHDTRDRPLHRFLPDTVTELGHSGCLRNLFGPRVTSVQSTTRKHNLRHSQNDNSQEPVLQKENKNDTILLECRRGSRKTRTQRPTSFKLPSPINPPPRLPGLLSAPRSAEIPSETGCPAAGVG
ncbi:hypothetical protein EX30DRAFT_158109 [Ascodesmis nigricans]|uniref:Uncharacterized protein n=1 Tax=Ascodesmis nigricans TaxID=341454 RepID=A0A4S2MRG2_9PEZI|nr:hypothetical protein EX30DRAFT_158109 [Ascodesmis nigricans]